VSVGSFRAVVDLTSTGPLAYVERSSPRHLVHDGIYTSTDYPAHQSIFPHNEHSYSIEFPRKLYFYCETPATAGGQTTLVPTRRVTRAIDPTVGRKFEALGWQYVRNLRPRVGVSWRDVFQCDRRSQAEDYCRSAQIDFEWTGADELRMVQRRPALEVHPTSREALWFNHIAFFHSSSLPIDVCAALREEFGASGLPNETYYGDGSVIDDDTAASLRQAYLDSVERFEWRAGDVLVIDNMLCAHGRESFVGPRRVLVAMADPVHRDKLRRSSV
jgi:alpha-ketoglutarate-dependent taurine dioxygenase